MGNRNVAETNESVQRGVEGGNRTLRRQVGEVGKGQEPATKGG